MVPGEAFGGHFTDCISCPGFFYCSHSQHHTGFRGALIGGWGLGVRDNDFDFLKYILILNIYIYFKITRRRRKQLQNICPVWLLSFKHFKII